jgi:azurin
MRVMVRLAAVIALAGFAGVSGLGAQAARVIQVTGSDAMAFSMPTITAKPGEALKIVLKVTSNLPPEQLKHNFVLLTPETDAMAFAMAAVMAKDTGYIPAAQKDKILAQSDMAANGQEVSVAFKAPAKPGTYPYICTFPGHFFAGMKGSLIVK